MSLINQMLKDLAQRSKPLSNPELILTGLLTPSYAKQKKIKAHYLWLITSMIVFISMFIFIVDQQHFSPKLKSGNTKSVPLPNFIPHAEISLSKISESKLSLNPAILTGITVSTQKEMTNLCLLLSESPLYRITSNGRDQLMIILENTRFTTSLPQINTMNSAVKMIRMSNQIDGSVKVTLMLKPGAELTHLALNESGRFPELRIDLSYLNVTLEEPEQSANDNIEEESHVSPIKKISHDTSVSDEYQQAMNLANKGEDKKAMTLLTRFLIKYPYFIPARKSLVALLLKQGDISTAQQMIDTGLRQQPFYPPYVQLKAQILVNKGEIKQALDLLLMAPPPLEENQHYYSLIAALYQRQNHFILAEKLYERLLTLQPSNPTWWMGLGIARESLRKNSEALIAYSKANNVETLSTELKIYAENRIRALQSKKMG